MDDGEITWRNLNKPKLFLYQFGVFMGIRACLYPATVLKTNLQVDQGATVARTARRILADAGIRGFWRGFPTIAFGIVPAQMVPTVLRPVLNSPRLIVHAPLV